MKLVAAIFIHERVRVNYPINLTCSIRKLVMKRTRLEIVSEILDISAPGITKTKIMYQAYLSYFQLTRYLKMLIDSGYLRFDEERKLYTTTPKGLELLRGAPNLILYPEFPK